MVAHLAEVLGGLLQKLPCGLRGLAALGPLEGEGVHSVFYAPPQVRWGKLLRAVRDGAQLFGGDTAQLGLGVRYYVSDAFELRHASADALRRVEERVEADNLHAVRRRCQAERNSKQRMVDAANAQQGPTRSQMLEQADAVHIRWCEEKERLEAASRHGS